MSQTQEKYMYGQGKVKLAEILPNGTRGPWEWIGDVSTLDGTFAETEVSHRESYSGGKHKVRSWFTEAELTWAATLHQLDVDAVARFAMGRITEGAQGTVTGEAFPDNLVVGDVVTLEHPGISSLVITDSAGTPATLDPEHYEYDAYGNVTLLSLPTSAPTQPFSAAYSYAATRQVAMLAGSRKQFALRYEGINLAENNQPIILELYKLSPGLLQTLSMITSGNQLASAPVNFTTLLDTSKPASGPLGRHGRIIEIAQA